MKPALDTILGILALYAVAALTGGLVGVFLLMAKLFAGLVP